MLTNQRLKAVCSLIPQCEVFADVGCDHGLVSEFVLKNKLSKKVENKILRAVGEPEKRFTEDALRIMRAFRFSAQLGFNIEESTLAAAKKLAPRLSNIARERIGSEFIRLLSSGYPEKALSLMENVLFEILPITEIEKDRFSLVEKLNSGGAERLALLLYGKANEDLLNVAHSLRLSNEQKHTLTLLATPTEDFGFSPASARRFLRHYGKDSSSASKMLSLLGVISPEFEGAVLEESEKDPCISQSRLAIGGADLISLGLASGKGVGILLSRLLDEVIEDPDLNEKSKLVDLARKMVWKI